MAGVMIEATVASMEWWLFSLSRRCTAEARGLIQNLTGGNVLSG